AAETRPPGFEQFEHIAGADDAPEDGPADHHSQADHHREEEPARQEEPAAPRAAPGFPRRRDPRAAVPGRPWTAIGRSLPLPAPAGPAVLAAIIVGASGLAAAYLTQQPTSHRQDERVVAEAGPPPVAMPDRPAT